MKVLENVLVAVDFGIRTESVVEEATRLAKTFGSQIHLLHVLPKLDESIPEAEDVMEMARRGALARLAEIRSGLDEAGARTAEEKVTVGIPFDQIIQCAEELDANVILVGSRTTERTAGPRLGTTAERLCRKSSKPVWVVAPEKSGDPKSILCPVDRSSASERALTNAVHLARRFNVQLTVLHVIRPVFALSGMSTSDARRLEDGHAKSETTKFESFLKRFDFHNVCWEKTVVQGIPEESILSAVSEFSAGLLVMGSVGRTGLSRILLGSVAGKLARQLPCSMILMKAEDAIRLKLEEDLSDLNSHYARAIELLENGFLDEAKHQFEHCIQTSDIFSPAWEGLAEVCQRQDKPDIAERFRETARQIEESLAWRRVEADVRRSHPLWKGN